MSQFKVIEEQVMTAFQAQQEYASNEDKRAADTEKLKAKIDAVGMGEFTRIFLEAHKDEKFILSPDEFTFHQPKEVQDHFLEVYHRELKVFNQRMITLMMPEFKSEGLAKVLNHLCEQDVPKQRIEQLLDEVISKKYPQ